ncbi:hypothetical protein CBR_g12528 [Chara braunii]|uniref:Uncharacterized protein n=1 Tax=Chara braunii TaxID=69332 RepID=A0A388JSN0_CHABU|nr:hypothetical protein CBR_g12528 [Chara braunii]|eukprot:GBG60790.1 hypothetical protein CBR_g12528 [Chara braunii]
MQTKEKEKQEERKLKEEEERKRAQEAAEGKEETKKEREEFENSLGKIDKDNIEVCEQMLGKKANSNHGANMESRDDTRGNKQEKMWRRGDAAAKGQIDRQKNKDIERLQRKNNNLVRMATGRENKELDGIKEDNQALIHDMLSLGDEVENLNRDNKRGVETVMEKSPPEELVRGKVKQVDDARTGVPQLNGQS